MLSICEDFAKEFPSLKAKRDLVIAPYTSFKVGGCADLAVFPCTVEELKAVVTYANGRYPYCVIGAGTNLLVSDKGFRGLVIFTANLKHYTLKGCILEAECGVKASTLSKIASENNLSGLEFAVGIPGTIGGLVAMNGGCFNKSISDVICYVRSENAVFNKQQCQFDYRSSRFLNGEIVLSAAFRLKACEDDVIEQKTERFISARSKSQPKGNSCGSTFRNEGYFAGKVIDQAGLKGYRIGGAKVSSEHANFIINEGGTAQDIYRLIDYVKKTVYSKCGILLNEEVRYIGDF